MVSNSQILAAAISAVSKKSILSRELGNISYHELEPPFLFLGFVYRMFFSHHGYYLFWLGLLIF
jgi:hypothetical protein